MIVHAFRVRKGFHYIYTLYLLLLSYWFPSFRKVRQWTPRPWRSDLFEPNPSLIPTKECIAQCEYELHTAYMYMLYVCLCIAKNPVFGFCLFTTAGVGISGLTGLPIPFVPPVAVSLSLGLFFLEQNLRRY
jgi:hypothetical protein